MTLENTAACHHYNLLPTRVVSLVAGWSHPISQDVKRQSPEPFVCVLKDHRLLLRTAIYGVVQRFAAMYTHVLSIWFMTFGFGGREVLEAINYLSHSFSLLTSMCPFL